MSEESVKNFLIETNEKDIINEIKMPERSGRIERLSSDKNLRSTLSGTYYDR